MYSKQEKKCQHEIFQEVRSVAYSIHVVH